MVKSRKVKNIFQSTPSVGRATMECDVCYDCMNISIHALRGEGDAIAPVAAAATLVFQSTPSVGRATFNMVWLAMPSIFQSTPSVGRATVDFRHFVIVKIISIHALRGEGDC